MKNVRRKNWPNVLSSYPVIMVSVWLVYTFGTEYITEIPVRVITIVEIVSAFAVILYMSIRDGYCFVRHAMIFHAFVCTAFYWYNKNYGFGDYLRPIHNVCSIVAIVLLFFLFQQQKDAGSCQVRKK